MKKVLGIFFLLSSVIFARELTLEETIQMAVNNSKNMKISEMDVKIAKLNVAKAFKAALPSVTYSGTYTRGEYDRTVYKKTGVSVKSKGGFYQNISISQPLFRGGAIFAGIKAAKAYNKAADLQYIGSKIDVRLAAIQSYCNIIKYQKNLYALEASQKELSETYKLQSEQLNLQLITKADILKTEQSILDIQSQIIAENNSISVEKENLRIQTGIPRNEEITLKEFGVPEYLTKSIDFEKDMNQAMTQSISALIAKYNVQVEDANKAVARAEMLPKVNAFADYGAGTERTRYRRTIDDASWEAGVQVTWNVFDFGSTYDTYKVAKLQAEQEKLKEQQTHDSIDIDVKKYYLELVRLEKSRESKYKAMQAAEESYAIDKERYNNGLMSTVDFLLSEESLRSSRVNYNTVLLDYYYTFEKYRSLLI